MKLQNFCFALLLLNVITAKKKVKKHTLPTRMPTTPLATASPQVCEQRSVCTGRPPNTSFWESNCFCDELCKAYDDCCKDVPSDFGVTVDKDLKEYAVCDRIPRLTREYAVYFVNRCPHSDDVSSLEVRGRCEDTTNPLLFDNLPVIGSTGIMYRNYYCAKCHGEKKIDFYRFRMNCTNSPFDKNPDWHNDIEKAADDVIWREKEADYNCIFDFLHPTHQARYCRTHISSCMRPWSDKRVKKKCKKKGSTSYVYANAYSLYRNVYCAMCNQVNVSALTCIDPRSPPPMTTPPPKATFAPIPPPRFSIVVRYGIMDTHSTLYENKDGVYAQGVGVDMYDCAKAGTIYDPIIQSCHQAVCPPGQSILQNSCVPASGTTTPFQPIREETPTPVPTTTTTPEAKTEPPKPTMPIVPTPDVFPPYEVFKECSGEAIALNASQYILHPNESIFVKAIARFINKDKYWKINDVFHICGPLTDVVPKPVGGPSHKPALWNQTTHVVLMFQFTSLQNLVSFIGLMISLAALFVHFVVYILLSPLRNIPGKCLISLVSALFAAQILLLVGLTRTDLHYLCVGLAAAMQYCFLVAFFWTNVMAIDIYRTFSPKCNQHPEDTHVHSARFSYYSLYAWLLPAVIVGGSLTMEYMDIKLGYTFLNLWRPHYGEGHCWMTGRNGLLYLFALPMAVLLTINILLYFMTIKNIYTVDYQSRMIHKEKEKNRFILTIKLALIMGATWIFAFLASLTDLPVLWYVFIAFNTLQGLFILLAYVCTKKVFKLMRSRGRVHRSTPYATRNVYSNGTNGRPCTRPTYMFHDGDIYKEIISQETSI